MRAAAFGAVLLTGCGFLAAPRENADIPPDAFGPYAEIGAVALCQDGVALGASGPDVSGFCTASDAPAAAACTADSDCAAEERCSCGRCVVPYCVGDQDCRQGQSCFLSVNRCALACAIDEDCTSGKRCDRGRCAKTCSGAGDCLRGEFCSRRLGMCQATPCSHDGPCVEGERCDAQRARRSFAEPAVIDRDGELVLFVEDIETQAIFRGRGTSRTAFELEAAPLVTDARGPAPLLDGSELVLYYARADGTALLRARDVDGVLEEGELVLVPDRPWEGGVVGAPSAARVGDRTILAYEASQGIGIAFEDGGAWTASAQPVATSETFEDPVLWREVSPPGSPMLLSGRTALGDDVLRLWVDARGAEGSATIVGPNTVPPPLNDSIGAAVSLDGGTTFTPAPFNPTFARVAELGRYRAESDPWVLVSAHGVSLWYVGSDVETGAAEGLGVAVSGH